MSEESASKPCARELREAPHVIDCWTGCEFVRVINRDCIVEACPRCKDTEYEYDVPGTDEQWMARAEEFKQARRQ
ncbi:MAG: hypothetical protein AB7U82_27725 [Blastocatellales bacterium]